MIREFRIDDRWPSENIQERHHQPIDPQSCQGQIVHGRLSPKSFLQDPFLFPQHLILCFPILLGFPLCRFPDLPFLFLTQSLVFSFLRFRILPGLFSVRNRHFGVVFSALCFSQTPLGVLVQLLRVPQLLVALAQRPDPLVE